MFSQLQQHLAAVNLNNDTGSTTMVPTHGRMIPRWMIECGFTFKDGKLVASFGGSQRTDDERSF